MKEGHTVEIGRADIGCIPAPSDRLWIFHHVRVRQVATVLETIDEELATVLLRRDAEVDDVFSKAMGL